MNRAAYFTTELGIKTLARVLKASCRFHNEFYLPVGPAIFVINHFTRLETLLLPYYLYQLTNKKIWSLAVDSLFQGALKSYFDRVGVVSTRDPQRDELIIRTLITSEANWIIFPEGRMVKNKKLIRDKEFIIGEGEEARSPHKGAAVLGLRAEIIRRILIRHRHDNHDTDHLLYDRLGCSEKNKIDTESVKLVPINLTYYPIRAHDNFLSDLANRVVKDPSERMLEELMAEGTMFLEGVDIDIRFGKPLDTADYLSDDIVVKLAGGPVQEDFDEDPDLVAYLKDASRRIMQIYMERIYAATTINHDHVLAYLLRKRSFSPFDRLDLARKAYLAVNALQKNPRVRITLHHSLTEDQIHLLSDDRYQKVSSFLNLGLESECLIPEQGRFKKRESSWRESAAFHQARISNPSEVMANELEPLSDVQKLLSRVGFVPDWLVRLYIARSLYTYDQDLYKQEAAECQTESEIDRRFGVPYLLPARSWRTGVVLVHSYLSVPEEMKEMATLLRKRGFWVYGVRLPGHGTDPMLLSQKSVSDWRSAVERGYAIMSALCPKVAMVGFSAGGMLVLELGSHLQCLSGMVAVCPPFTLHDYSNRFKPPKDIWNRLLQRWKGNRNTQEFVEFEPENAAINYHHNPVAGVDQVGDLLEKTRDRFAHLSSPTLIISADQDQVIGSRSSLRVYEAIASEKKELLRITSTRHNIITGDLTGVEPRVRDAIASFLLSHTR
ncbi:MAG: alpha/beta fold hydrolase [Desulfobulbaceae bacterium]|nr:alpha/beta fold hydrolase [Desulfofustis sp.]RZW25002.1 MAG: alpha/beta fold hydrolase [Desulfobulbaceae bacterium]